jgi:hypothetical protein
MGLNNVQTHYALTLTAGGQFIETRNGATIWTGVSSDGVLLNLQTDGDVAVYNATPAVSSGLLWDSGSTGLGSSPYTLRWSTTNGRFEYVSSSGSVIWSKV